MQPRGRIEFRHLGTTLAAHNEAIYGEELGLTSEEMAALP